MGQNGSLVSDINFCAETPVGAGVTNGFYLLLENTALSHPPAHCTHKPFSPSRRAQPREQGTESCPAAPSVPASIYVGPRRLHLLRRAVYLMSWWREMLGLSHHCWAAGLTWVCVCTASQASSVSVGNQSLGVSSSQQGPGAFSSDISSSSVAEIQETIKILMRSREDFK